MKPVRNDAAAMTSAIAGGRAGSAVVSIDKRFPDGHCLIILECSTAAGARVSEGLEVRSTFQRRRQNGKDNGDAEELLHSIAFSDTVEIKATWGFSSCIGLIRPACRTARSGKPVPHGTSQPSICACCQYGRRHSVSQWYCLTTSLCTDSSACSIGSLFLATLLIVAGMHDHSTHEH
jgi:hypothetical protein